MLYKDKQAIVTGTVVWQNLASPEINENTGKPQYVVRLAIAANEPSLQSLWQRYNEFKPTTKRFANSDPTGDDFPIKPVADGEFLGMFPGGVYINAKRNQFFPETYTDQRVKLDETAAKSAIYPGQVVKLIVDFWEYDNVKRGIGVNLHGIQAQLALNSPQLSFGSSGVDVADAFGDPNAQQQAQQMPQQAQQMPQQAQQMPQQAQQMPQQVQQMPQQAQQIPQQAQQMPQQVQQMPQQAQQIPQQAQQMPQQAQQPMQQAQQMPQQAQQMPQQGQELQPANHMLPPGVAPQQ